MKKRKFLLKQMFNKIRKSISKKSLKTTGEKLKVNLNFEKELPKLNFDYKLNFELYKIDKLITEIFQDLKNEGFTFKT